MSLYDLIDELERALADPTVMDPETGELLDEARLNNLQMAIEHKACNVALYIRGEELEADKVAVEVERLSRREGIHRKRADRLRLYLASIGKKGDKFKDARITVNLGESLSCEVVEEKKVPNKWKVQPPLPAKRVDKKAALVELKAGKEIPGLRLKRKPTVSIK